MTQFRIENACCTYTSVVRSATAAGTWSSNRNMAIHQKLIRLIVITCLSLLLCQIQAFQQPTATNPRMIHRPLNAISRRTAMASAAATPAAALLLPLIMLPNEADAESLAAKLSKRDAAALKNSIFNIPPSAQIYPPFMKGNWDVSLKFAGYLFPSKTIPKDDIVKNFNVPGFQKCSIANLADVGRENTTFRLSIQDNGMEDRVQTLSTSINAHLGYKAVENVLYDPSSNPNRISIEFVKSRTRNAERIELFCNARESELVQNPAQDKSNLKIFVCSEYARQVTFSLSQEFGVAREVIGNYAHFWTWKETEDSNVLTGNVLTACYLDPQDALFFKEPSKPVAVYSHSLVAKRV